MIEFNSTFRWSSKICSEKHYFICQHHLTTVSDKDRVDVYNKWNETYPHQMANEFVVFVKGNNNRNRDTVTTVRAEVSTVKSIDDSFVLDSRNTDLHPVHNTHAIGHGENVKPKKRHSVLKLTGEVNLGIDKRERKRARKQQGGVQKGIKPSATTTSTAFPGRNPPITTEQSPSTSAPTTTEQSLETTTPTTTTQGYSTTISNSVRLERLKERLAKLSPEDKKVYLQMKRERLETKKKYNQTI